MNGETPTKVNGMAGVLTTLASSGDNWVKLLIVGGLILNGFLTKKDGSATRADVDKVRQTALKQIGIIYRNQNRWATFAKVTDQENRLMMEALQIPKEKWPVVPPMEFEREPKPEEEDQ